MDLEDLLEDAYEHELPPDSIEACPSPPGSPSAASLLRKDKDVTEHHPRQQQTTQQLSVAALTTQGVSAGTAAHADEAPQQLLEQHSDVIVEDLGAELLAADTDTQSQSVAQASEWPADKRKRVTSADPDAAPYKIPKKEVVFKPLRGHDDILMSSPVRDSARPQTGAIRRHQAPTYPGPHRAQQRVYRSIVTAGATGSRCIPLRGDGGADRVFCRVRKLGEAPHWHKSTTQFSHGEGLLGEPVGSMLQRLETEELEATYAKLRRLQEDSALKDDVDMMDVGAGSPVHAANGTGSQESRLWVDQYAPRSYMQLLSAEVVNAAVLSWLKQWDATVFGRTPQRAPHGSTDTRPEQKAILLAGPPGIGKTTLAHVVARHCGYRVVEINASDERTRSSLLAAMSNAVQMQAVVGEKRPNCLVIDEIDGVAGGEGGAASGGGAVKALAQIIQTGELEVDEAPAAGDGKAKGRRRKRRTLLRRPIICICNDLHVPVLRPLRAVVQVVVMQPPQPLVLTARLRNVCIWEDVDASDRALQVLATKTGCDIRSCLNTLQLLAKRHKEILTEHVQKTSVGEKDMKAGPFDAWQRLLLTRHKRGDDYSFVAAFGEHDLLLRGVHENMLQLPYMDHDLSRTSAMCSWMQDYDIWNHFSTSKQAFGLMPMLSAAILGAATLCSAANKMRLKWPSSLTDAHKQHVSKRELAAEWLTRAAPAVSACSTRSAVVDYIPSLVCVLSPRPDYLDNLLLMSQKAKHQVASKCAVADALVARMTAYGVTYDLDAPSDSASSRKPWQMADAHEAPAYWTPLQPALHSFQHYSFVDDAPLRPVLSEAIRTALLHRRQLVLARADAPIVPRGKINAPDSLFSGSACADSVSNDDRTGAVGGTGRPEVVRGALGMQAALRSAEPARGKGAQGRANWLTSLSSSVQKARARRQLGVRSGLDGGVQCSQTSGKLHFPVTYIYHEGYTNAVKRPLRLSDLQNTIA